MKTHRKKKDTLVLTEEEFLFLAAYLGLIDPPLVQHDHLGGPVSTKWPQFSAPPYRASEHPMLDGM